MKNMLPIKDQMVIYESLKKSMLKSSPEDKEPKLIKFVGAIAMRYGIKCDPLLRNLFLC